MVEALIIKNNYYECELSVFIDKIKDIAERKDYFTVYKCLETALTHTILNDDIKSLANDGLLDSLRLARIDAERGVYKRMSTYLELAVKYSQLLGEDVSEAVNGIRALGEENRIVDNTPIKKCKCGMNRIAGYADL